jgi:hypothetical protein
VVVSLLASILGAILLTTERRKRKKLTAMALPYTHSYVMVNR